MELTALILCLIGGGVFAGGMLIEGMLAVLDRIEAIRRSNPMASAETDESQLSSAFRRPTVDRFRTHWTRPVHPSAKRRTTAPSR